jgi:hypothetical protein
MITFFCSSPPVACFHTSRIAADRNPFSEGLKCKFFQSIGELGITSSDILSIEHKIVAKEESLFRAGGQFHIDPEASKICLEFGRSRNQELKVLQIYIGNCNIHDENQVQHYLSVSLVQVNPGVVLYLMPGVKMYRQIACQREST